MKKSLLTVVFVLGLSAAVAFAQAGAGSAQSASPGNYPGQAGSYGSDRMGQQAPMSEQQPGMNQDKKSSSMANVDDETLHRQVHEQLASNPDLQNVQISVNKGIVTLEGTVPNKSDKKEARKLAKSVPGVRGVKEHLTVNPSAASAAAPSGMGGVSGQASTSGAGATEKPPSGAVAGQAGATSAAEQPGISGQAGASTQTPEAGAGAQAGMGAQNPDQQLQSQIETALRNEPTLSNSSINVNVTADKIELSGSVPSGKDRQTAKRIAQSFAGNRKVVDNITVSGQGSNTENPPKQ